MLLAPMSPSSTDGRSAWSPTSPTAGFERTSTPLVQLGGPEKDGSEEEALGRSQGGFGTKVHIRAEGNGRLMRLLLTSGQRNESTVFERLLEGASVRRRGPGRPRQKPGRVVGDKGYSSRAIRRYCLILLP